MPRKFLSQISLEVVGRTNRRGRVYYRLSMDGEFEHQAIPEQIVLKRWRQLSNNTYTCHGCRLGPNMWRSLADVDFLAVDWLEQVQRLSRSKASTSYKLPALSSLEALWGCLGGSRLAALQAFGQTMLSKNRFGTPDLFLWVTEKSSNRKLFGSFAEVKRPGEPVSRDQRLMLWAMKRMGMNATLLRLREVDSISCEGKPMSGSGNRIYPSRAPIQPVMCGGLREHRVGMTSLVSEV